MALGEFLGPMQEMGVKFKHLGVMARPERLRNLVFNSCNSKTHLKIMKLGMVSGHWHQHAAVIFLAELGQALV